MSLRVRTLKYPSTLEEQTKFFKGMRTPSRSGYIETNTPGYNPMVRGHKDGLGAVLTDAYVSPSDILWLTDMFGVENTKLITRHHSLGGSYD